MADIKISELGENTTPLSTDVIPEVSGGATKKVSIANILAVAALPGEIRMYGGAAAPTGWLLCDGTSYERAAYTALFAVISTTYGSADGTHFNVPDMRGRAPVGVGTGTGGGAAGTGLPIGGSALTAVALGTWTGAETHALSTAELATHLHTVNPPNTTSTTPSADHVHSMGLAWSGAVCAGGSSNYGNVSSSGNTGGASPNTHTHDVNIAEFDSGNAGSGTAHNTRMPLMGVNFIIKT